MPKISAAFRIISIRAMPAIAFTTISSFQMIVLSKNFISLWCQIKVSLFKRR
jgi:hypothetical protein